MSRGVDDFTSLGEDMIVITCSRGKAAPACAFCPTPALNCCDACGEPICKAHRRVVDTVTTHCKACYVPPELNWKPDYVKPLSAEDQGLDVVGGLTR